MSSDREAQMQAFLAGAGWGDAVLKPLQGDASTRRYLRAELRGRKAMVMDQPQNAETPPAPAGASDTERLALGYNAVARLAGADCGRFVAVAHYLRSRGLSAPEIYACDPAEGFVLLEDLGDELYADAVPAGADETQLYRTAVEALAQLHMQPAPAQLASGVALHRFDSLAMLAETDLLTQWFLPLAAGTGADAEAIEQHRALWKAVLDEMPCADRVFVHRDYHAQNLLWLGQRHDVARAGMIDFQDALAGPRSYDLVSLLEDARRDVPPELASAMTSHYLAAMRAGGHLIDEAAQRREMAIMAAQRNAKIVGIFARLCRRDGKPRYLSYLPRVWRYLEHDLSHPALAPLKAWYDARIPRDRRGALHIEGASA